MDPSMDLLTDLQVETVHIIPHSILDQITEITTATPTTATFQTPDNVTTETTIEAEDINKTQDTTKETKTTKTGMITIKIEIGLTTEDDQTNTNTIETNQEHRSSLSTQIRTY